jgi:hypothetical protein
MVVPRLFASLSPYLPTPRFINAFLIIRSSFVFCKGGRRWLHAGACLMRLECRLTGREFGVCLLCVGCVKLVCRLCDSGTGVSLVSVCRASDTV